MATFTNQTKHTVTVKNPNKAGIAAWDDGEVTWDDANFSWDSLGTVFTNQTKNIATITNLAKS